MLTKKKRLELEAETLDALLKTFSPSKDIHKLSSQFISWCRKNKLDPKKQSMNGRMFKLFIIETNKICREVLSRATELVCLLKFESPLPMGSESAYEGFYNDGWNDCIMAVIKGGRLPDRERKKSEVPYKWAMKEGWNAAIEKMEKKHFEFFK